MLPSQNPDLKHARAMQRKADAQRRADQAAQARADRIAAKHGVIRPVQ